MRPRICPPARPEPVEGFPRAGGRAPANALLPSTPIPSPPPIPYPTPMPTHTRPNTRTADSTFENFLFRIPCLESPLSATDSKSQSNPCAHPPPSLRRRSLPLRRQRARPARHAVTPGCFPLSSSGHFAPMPSAHVRPVPCQIRFVSLCPLSRRPQTGPSRPRSARAWQIRFVSLCPLVRRASTPSWTVSPQARSKGENAVAQFNSTQTPTATPVGVTEDCVANEPSTGRCGSRACPGGRRPRRRVPYGRRTPMPGGAHDRPHT